MRGLPRAQGDGCMRRSVHGKVRRFGYQLGSAIRDLRQVACFGSLHSYVRGRIDANSRLRSGWSIAATPALTMKLGFLGILVNYMFTWSEDSMFYTIRSFFTRTSQYGVATCSDPCAMRDLLISLACFRVQPQSQVRHRHYVALFAEYFLMISATLSGSLSMEI